MIPSITQVLRRATDESNEIPIWGGVVMKRVVTIMFLGLALLGGCGKNNESGKSSSSLCNGLGYCSSLGNIGVGAIPTNVTNPYVKLVFQSMPCTTGGGRVGVQMALQQTVAANATYIGITSEGDIAMVTSSGGQGILSAYLCQRPGLASGQLTRNPVLNRSSAGCLIDEITAASMVAGQYVFAFRPIQYGGPGNLNAALGQLRCGMGY